MESFMYLLTFFFIRSSVLIFSQLCTAVRTLTPLCRTGCWSFSMILAFDIRPAFIHSRHIQLCLISRRSRYRAGTRYFRRGLDHQGHVANFNETEQLLFVEDQQSSGQRVFDDFSTKMSFVQIRGSVPVFWAEINTLRYKPDLQVMDLQDTVSSDFSHYLIPMT